jgi:ferric-dicitrate binding protein FerR (iron transport regulator)
MNRYANFSTEDLVLDADFCAWVLAPTPARDQQWADFLRTHPQQGPRVQEARLLVLAMRAREPEVTDGQVAQSVAKLAAQLASEAAPAKPLVVGLPHSARRWWAVAASVALLAALGTSLWWTSQPQTSAPAVAQTGQTPSQPEKAGAPARRWQETANPNAEPLLVNLPDGSSVLLAAGSRVRYELAGQAANREVYLDGEGFFEVAKNPQRPFVVYANGLETKVTGTSFRVRAYAHEARVSVRVKTGRVHLRAQADSTGARELVLAPNQGASLLRQAGAFPEKEATAPLASQPLIEQQTFVFDFAPVGQVLALLEQTYGVPIEYDREQMAHCTIKATLGDEPFLDKLRLVCLATEATFEQVGGKVVIKATQSCQPN